jgi:TonB family protein
LKFLAFALIIFFTASIKADEVTLVPIFSPAPQYPEVPIRPSFTNKVRVKLTIESSGRVQSVKVIESSHGLLSKVVQKALLRWRYRPWRIMPGAPATVSVTLPIIFGPRGSERSASEINIGLGNVLCAYLNYEVAAAHGDYPKESLSKVDLFWYAREFLSSPYMELRVPEAGKRQSMLMRLQASVPRVIKRCRRNPEGRFGDYLPKDIREVLVGIAQPEVLEWKMGLE